MNEWPDFISDQSPVENLRYLATSAPEPWSEFLNKLADVLYRHEPPVVL